MLELAGVHYSVGAKTVLQNVSTAFQSGQVTGIIGPNGAGKTSLLRLAAGLQRPDSGAVLWDGTPLTAHHAWTQKLAYLPQFQTVAWPLSCRDVVGLGLLPFGAPDADKVMAALETCGAASFCDRTIDTLSGGEQARVHLARLLVGDASCLLLDEPVQSLDAAGALAVMGLLRQATHTGRAVAVVLHDLHLAAQFCDHIVLMDGGTICAQGAPDEVLSAQRLSPIFGVEFDAIDASGHALLVARAKTSEAI